jgi:hypothetical protein
MKPGIARRQIPWRPQPEIKIENLISDSGDEKLVILIEGSEKAGS